jgi:hypothetical protein
MKHPLDISVQLAINNKHDEAEKILRDYIKEYPNDPRVLFNLGWHDLRHGKMQKGYEGLNVGRFINVIGSPAIPGKIWKDEPIENKTILFRCEGGAGDQIMNVRFANEIKNLGANVVVSCDPKLMQLFAKNGFIAMTTTLNFSGQATTELHSPNVYYDYWVPAMSAAYILKHEYNTISGKPYLKANKRVLNGNNNYLKVGVRWAGNPKFEHQQHRKFDPQLMIDLHKTPNTTFYSLQRDDDTIEDLPFIDLKKDLTSWVDTAEIIAGLDLVITSCTSIAHLAGAMGIPTWVVVPCLPYYSWAVPGSKTVWYDSVRLFRQEVYGDWSHPFEEIKKELEKLTLPKEVA